MITIVTTTINPPTRATLKFAELAKKNNWAFLVVGDLKTPHHLYEELDGVTYLSPEYQETNYRELSDTIGWKSIQRRNIGFVEAYKHYSNSIVATVDDDNIPYDNWGANVSVGQEVEVDLYENKSSSFFEPFSVTNHKNLWHRGYPIQDLAVKNNIEYKGKVTRKVLVQADFWDGDPDIDAICRLNGQPIVKFDAFDAFTSNQLAPFNSQNTFLDVDVLPSYAVLPHVGRMDDIWGSYLLQHKFPNSVIYKQASVYQDRNVQDLVTNLENEIIGYRNTKNLLTDLNNYCKYLPEKTCKFWDVYTKCF
jgi:hypothetical protein